jgi:predicted HD phosphohydrolase
VKTVSYEHMADMTEEDARLIEDDADEEAKLLPDRVLEAVRALERFRGPLRVTRFEHSLQSATRAHRDGRDEEYVVAALVHDIGDALAPHSHGDYVAAVLKPYVSERICWIIKMHPLFQLYYYGHHLGADRNARDVHRGHPWYDDCVEFCERYDQNCFETGYDSLPLEFFEPMVRRVFTNPRFDSI